MIFFSYYYLTLLLELSMTFVTHHFLTYPRILNKLFYVHLHNLIVQFMFVSTFLIYDIENLMSCIKSFMDKTAPANVRSYCEIFIDPYSFLVVYSVAPYLNILNLQCTIFQQLLHDYLDTTYHFTTFCQSILLIYLCSPLLSNIWMMRMLEMYHANDIF